MATATVESHCSQCDEEKDIYECKGCSKTFCFDHLTKHREEIDQEFIQIEHHCNSFRQIILDQKNDSNKHPLIQEIEQWKQESIQKIEQTAIQCQQRLIRYTNQFLIQTENQLNQLTEQLKQIRQKNKLNEFDLDQLKNKLTKLQKELEKPLHVTIEQQPISFINKISVIISFPKAYLDTKLKQNGITVAGGNGSGKQFNQLYYPWNICMDDNQTLFIADLRNHRIVQWKSNATNGQLVAGGNGLGNQNNQLNGPTDVILDQENHSLIIADQGNRRVIQWSRQNHTQHEEILLSDIDCCGLTMDNNGSLYVSDYKKNEVKRWKRGEKEGTIVAGGNGKGNHLNQLDNPSFIFVDKDESLYVSEENNHRVVKWIKDAKEGIIVAGGNGEGNSLRQLSAPRGVIVDQLGQIYVADENNNRVMCWWEGEKKGSIVVGGNGRGKQSNQLNGPSGLSFDRRGNLYVADYWNHRIQKFELN